MTMNRGVKGALYVAIAALAVNAVRLAIKVEAQSVVPVGTRVVPYTATLTETVINSNGSRLVAPSQTWAVRSDGASVLKIGDGAIATRRLRFPSGLLAEVSDARRARSTTYKPVQGSWILDPRQNCAKTLSGVSTVPNPSVTLEQTSGYRTARISSDGMTHWYALDFGCAPVRRTIDFGKQGVSHLDLVSLISGEPPVTLFGIPDQYEEGAPSKFAHPPSENCDAACKGRHRDHFEKLDKSYYLNRPPKE